MDYKIVVTPIAQNQIEESIVYYKTYVSMQVAISFIKEYSKTFSEIQKTKYFRFFNERYRGKPMKKFPFIIFYSINEQEKIIFIKAVFNTHINPSKYPK